MCKKDVIKTKARKIIYLRRARQTRKTMITSYAIDARDNNFFPALKPGQNLGQKPGQKPGQKSGQKPGQKSGQNPGQKSGQKPCQKSAQKSGQNIKKLKK